MIAPSEPAPQTLRAETPHLTVRYPSTLSPDTSAAAQGADLALVADLADAPFRPNMVFTSIDSTAPLVDAAMAAYLGAEAQHPGAHILAVDAHVAPGFGIDDAPIGRVFTFTYPATEALDVMVKKWVVATGSQHLHFSASFLPSQALVVEATMNWIAENVVFAASAEELQAAARGDSVSGVQLDSDATTRTGFPLEDLSVLTPAIPRSAREVAASAADRLARAWGIPLDQPRVFHAIVTDGDRRAVYLAYSGEAGILVIRSAGRSALNFDPSRVEAYGLSPDRLPSDIAAWFGIAPGFRFGTGTTIPARVYADRIGARADGEAWIEVQMSLAGAWLHAVHIPGEGYSEASRPSEDEITLRPLPAGRFSDLILRRIDAVLGAHDDETADDADGE